MAKSRLVVRRTQKKATILASVQTVKDAIRRANMLAEELMNENQNDPRVNKLTGAVSHLTRILKATPQEMRANGVSSVEDYFDDAKQPAEATKIKNEVNMIAKMHDEARARRSGPATPLTPEQQGVGYVPDQAVAEHGIAASDKTANGSFFSTDRDEKGEAKMPEKAEVPRLAAKRKKKEAEDEEPIAPPTGEAEPVAPIPPAEPAAAAAPVAPAPAAPAAPSSGASNPIEYIPTETLIKVIGDLAKEDDFAQNRNKQDALVALTEIIKQRPVLPPDQPEGQQQAAPAAPTAPGLAPVAASKTADLGDHASDGYTEPDGSGAATSIGPSGLSAGSPTSSAPAPAKATPNFGGLSVAGSVEEKTADDYRLHDYKVQDEGLIPTGQLPGMDEQEQMMHPEEEHEACMGGEAHGTFEKESVTPPGVSEETMHKLKSEYPGEPEKAYATAWSIHNKQTSLAVRAAAEEFVKKVATAYGGSWFSGSGQPMEMDEDGGRLPELAEAHAGLDYSPARLPNVPVVEPIKLNKQAAEMTTSKAVKQAESTGNELKKMYLEAKSITGVNDTRAVREAVELIFKAADAFDQALKVLSKQDEQEKSEAAAQEMKAKNKKSSQLGGLALAAAE